MTKKEIKVTIVTFEDSLDLDYVEPSRWYIRMATGDLCYWHCRSRAEAQQACDEEFGKSKYAIRTSKLQKPSGDVTVRGTQTR